MSVQIIMDHSGDTRHQFEKTDDAAIKEAMDRFNQLVGLGYTPAEKTGPGTSKLVREFNPEAVETLFIPRLMGG